MKGRNAEPAREDEQQDERVHGRDSGPRDADRREQCPAGDQPERPTPVGQEPEQRLHERRGGRRREQEHRRERVPEVELVGHERDQRRHAPRREIDREVPTRQRPHRAPVDPGPHASMLAIGHSAKETNSNSDPRPTLYGGDLRYSHAYSVKGNVPIRNRRVRPGTLEPRLLQGDARRMAAQSPLAVPHRTDTRRGARDRRELLVPHHREFMFGWCAGIGTGMLWALWDTPPAFIENWREGARRRRTYGKAARSTRIPRLAGTAV